MRGERLRRWQPCRTPVGSSPHARGTQSCGLVLGHEHRFIPACAGNAVCLPTNLDVVTVHPRMRGERSLNERSNSDFCGSSPHARGTQGGRHDQAGGGRFIPACAGNADSPARTAPAGSVHPRMRGERSPRNSATRLPIGSSPHARGTLRLGTQQRMHARFIPACAGNASSVTCPGRTSTVHPRMRGERPKAAQGRAPLRGSSPHARGTHGRRRPALAR